MQQNSLIVSGIKRTIVIIPKHGNQSGFNIKQIEANLRNQKKDQSISVFEENIPSDAWKTIGTRTTVIILYLNTSPKTDCYFSKIKSKLASKQCVPLLVLSNNEVPIEACNLEFVPGTKTSMSTTR